MLRGIPEPLEAANQMVQGPNGWVHVTDRPGYGPPVLLMHGFPDDSRIYDRLVQLLAPRRVVALDCWATGPARRRQ